jgi:hypothetical protein
MLTASADLESPTASDRTVTNTGFGSPISSIASPSPIVPDSSPPKRRSKPQIIIPNVTFACNQQFKKNIFSEQVYETTTTTTTMSPDNKMLFSSFATTKTTNRNSLIHLQGPLTPGGSGGRHENYFKMLHTSPTGHLEPLVMNVPDSKLPRIVFNADSFNSDTTDESSSMEKTGSSKENTMVSMRKSCFLLIC